MKKIKMPSSYTILFLIIIFIAALTWVIPSGEYYYECSSGEAAIEYTNPTTEEVLNVCPVSGAAETEINAAVTTSVEVNSDLYTTDSTYTYQETEAKPQGLWQVMMAPINGFYDAVDIALFVLIIGGFINVVMETGALSAGINSLLKKFKNKEHLLIPILMTLFALGGTTYGMAEETIAFYLLIVPIFYKAGYDTVTGVKVILLGAGVGVLASTVNPFAIGVASGAAGTSMGAGIVGRTILWIIVLIITILYTMRYASKVKKDPSKSIVYDLREEHKKEFNKEQEDIGALTLHHKVVLGMFGLSFVLMVCSVIPWENFGIYLFSNIGEFLNQNVKFISGNDGIPLFGEWWFGELTTLFLVFSIIVGVYAKKTKILKADFISTFIAGANDLLSVALIIGLSRGIQIIMASSGMDATLLYYGSNALSNLGQVSFSIFAFLFYLPMSFLIPSTSGLAGATIPVMGPLGDMIFGSSAGSTQVITAYSGASGIINLITPTSGVVMGGLALARVPYDRWLKHLIPFILLMCGVMILFLTITTMTGFYL